jgi:hypothetical protein
MKTNSVNLYDQYLKQLTGLLFDSSHQDDPAYWLYLNNARTPLFMLEAITRILYKSTSDKEAEKWHSLFKKLEDILGQIDYYDVLIKQFKPNKAIGEEPVRYLEKKLDKVTSKLNRKLKKKEFYLPSLNEVTQSGAFDFNDKGLLIAFHEQVKTEILIAEEFFSTFHNGFSDFEEQVHDLRRKLRWISIYSTCLGGSVILKPGPKKYKWEKEFITRKEIESKFNKLPVKKGWSFYIPINKKAFYALSHVIDKLGEIKDKGLAIEALAKAIRKTTGNGNGNDHREQARTQLRIKETEDELLKQAYDLLYRFFVVNKIHVELLG